MMARTRPHRLDTDIDTMTRLLALTRVMLENVDGDERGVSHQP